MVLFILVKNCKQHKHLEIANDEIYYVSATKWNAILLIENHILKAI